MANVRFVEGTGNPPSRYQAPLVPPSGAGHGLAELIGRRRIAATEVEAVGRIRMTPKSRFRGRR